MALNNEEMSYLKCVIDDHGCNDADINWLVDFCTRNDLSYKQLCFLSMFFQIHCSNYKSVIENNRDSLKEEISKLFVSKNVNVDFMVDYRIKGFVRTLKKIDRKIQCSFDTDDDKRNEWIKISGDTQTFIKAISEYVSDFLGLRVITISKQSCCDIESLKNDSLSPEEFLFEKFIPASLDLNNRDEDALYLIRDCLYKQLGNYFDNTKSVSNGKDYLVNPKENGYRSIQFYYLLDNKNNWSEIQIKNILHHMYAEFEHRRYEGNLLQEDAIPFYLVCDICSKFFVRSELQNANLSTIAHIYYICLAVLEAKDFEKDKLNHVLYDANCDDNSFHFSDEIMKLCFDVIQSTRDYLLRDYERDNVPCEIVTSMKNLDDNTINICIDKIRKKICGRCMSYSIPLSGKRD